MSEALKRGVRAALRAALLAVLLASLALPSCAEDVEMAYSRAVDVPGLGVMPYYAQNDPAWAMMAYRPTRYSDYIVMRDSGCGVTAVAMAVARQLSPDELCALAASARDPERGFPICACSANGYQHGGDDHEVFTPRTGEEYAAWLPAVIAGYATGNNTHRRLFYRDGGGTNITLVEEIASAYGMTYRSARTWEMAKACLDEGYSVVTTVGRGIFTNGSHYLVVLGVADGYIYLFDPLARVEYPLDEKGVLEIVEAGLLRALESDFEELGLSGYYMMKRAD